MNTNRSDQARTTKENSLLQAYDQRLTSKEAAKWLRQKVGTLAMWRSQSKGPCYIKCGGKVLYLMSDLIAFARKNRIITG